MTFKGLFQLKLFSDSVIFLDADQRYVPTLQSVVWKGVEQWWPKSGGWTGGVEVRGLSEQRGTDPFLFQLLRQASEGLFLHSLLASSGSFSAECFEVALFSCFHDCCSFAAKTWRPTLFCYWPKEQESCCSPVGVFSDELSQYHSADAWLLDVNNCFLFHEHIYEYCMSVYFPT